MLVRICARGAGRPMTRCAPILFRSVSNTAVSNTENSSSFAAMRMGNLSLAAADPVEDYRVLAAGDFWAHVIGGRQQLACLDVCSGTGRWMQTFSENVLRPLKVTASFDCVDLCSDSLAHLETRFHKIPEISTGRTHCLDAGKLESLGGKFDLATNMHGLYAIPRESLRNVVASMIGTVAPGGTCIIALGDNNSFYLRHSNELVKCGVMPVRETSADDVFDVLNELGVAYEKINLDYVEKTSTDKQLRHFIENESGGNTWPADDDRTGKALTSFDAPNVKKLLDQFMVCPGVHHFPQSTSVFLIRR